MAATEIAEAAGIHPGQSLADAKALCPKLATAAADRVADARGLERLAAWCRRFSPWTSSFGDGENGGDNISGEAGIWLEVTGCAHLVGGERALTDIITGAMGRAGFTVRAGLAGTPGAAHALARFSDDPVFPGGKTGDDGAGAIAAPGEERAALAPLPVAALRLDGAIIEGLNGLGLRRIGDLYPLIFGPKRAMLTRRFPPLLLDRIDQALGLRFEPINLGRERPRFATRLALPEPTRSEAAIARVCERLVTELAALLNARGLGAKRFVFTAFTTDGRAQQTSIGTARAMAAAGSLMRLFELKLGGIDPGSGIDGFCLEAFATSPLQLRQGQLARVSDLAPDAAAEGPAADIGPDLAPLIDRLGARFGRKRVGRIVLRPNHLPERAQAFAKADSNGGKEAGAGACHRTPPSFNLLPRPVRLLLRPEPVDARAEIPGGPLAWFCWRGVRHPVTRCQGPERIALDWWTLPGWQANPCAPAQPPGLGAAIRDYYQVETAAGARFWIYRVWLPRPDTAACWFLHGIFP